MADAWLLAGVLAIEDSSSSGSTWNRPAQCSPWSHRTHATTSSTNWVARSSAYPSEGTTHGGPCASALQDEGTTVVHARALCKISRPARGQWRRTDGQLRWRRAGSLQHRAPGSVVSWERRVPADGRRKYRQSPRSHAGESHLNLPLGLGFFVGAIEWGSSDRVGLERSSGARAIGWGSSDRVGLGQAIRS